MISDADNGLESEMANLTKDNLIDRLLVAEKMMKKLFEVNREHEKKLEKFDNGE